MLRIHAMTVGLAVALLGLASTVVFAQQGGDYPVSRGVVATITALDAKTTMATLQTEAGEVFELPKRWQWHVGHKVECDRITGAPRPRLQHCQPWESAHAAGDASMRTPATRTELRGASATEAAGAADEVRFLATPSRPEPGAAPAGRRALAGTVEMTCTQQQETPLTIFRGGVTTRTTCTSAKGPDGQEVPVRVRDSRVGHTLQCAEKEGKITCPDDPMPAFQPVTGVTQ